VKIVREEVNGVTIVLYDLEPTPDRICEDVARGLSAEPRKLPAKYFYDARGARLFHRITELEAYYPTRTELSILRRHGAEIGKRIGPRVRLVEFGSGSGEKTRILLAHLDDPATYIPVDISRVQLVEFSASVVREFPNLRVVPVCADYTRELVLPENDEGAERCVAYFPGSTIGNFERAEAGAFLERVRRLVGADGGFLLGVDLLKDRATIERAYNDPEGVTAEFNLNLLRRINRECGADFDLGSFRHEAFFDEAGGRVEMRLVATADQVVHLHPDPVLADANEVRFAAGDHITTEYSHKFDIAGFTAMAERAGWRVGEVWTDPAEWFAVVFLN
jgi:dimethylhistidine N-methyltransferase